VIEAGQKWRSPEGDVVTVRGVRGSWVDFAYVGPSGKDGVYPADTSGRSSEHERAFRALFQEDGQ
jgi:hypothetical protein